MFNTNSNSNVEQWQKMLVENFDVKDKDKLDWISQYATIHQIHESMPGNLYANPMNTMGMGQVAAPQNPSVDSTMPGASGNQWNQSIGSGDTPISTLPMALNIALLTIGLELVPVVPSKGPWQLMSYMDFPYGGGKMNIAGNLTSLDGIGEGKENKPIYIKVLGKLDEMTKIAEKLTVDAEVTVKNSTTNTIVFTGKYKGKSRMDAGIILETVKCMNDSNPCAITEVFNGGKVKITGGSASDDELTEAKADFVQTSVDFVDGFANFATGGKEAMTRAQNETGVGNTIGLRLFSKWVPMGSYEVTGTVTRQQLQDLPLYGVDAVGKVMEAMQNEITQSINARILERVFRLGVTNALQQKAYQNVDLNLYLGKAGTSGKALNDYPIKEYIDIYGVDHKSTWGDVANQEVLTSAENTFTRQRRIASRILAAANLIQTVGRRGRADWAVVNTQIASALQDISSYVVNPIVNTLSQDGTQNLYLGGTLAGLKIYVDPYMDWNDTRICVGRKGDGNSPGVVFMPYILADQVSITAEGTMAPKMLVNSRYAIADAGFYPEAQYYTFAVYSDFGLI